MAACFFAEMSHVKPPAKGVIEGMFVSKLNRNGDAPFPLSLGTNIPSKEDMPLKEAHDIGETP